VIIRRWGLLRERSVRPRARARARLRRGPSASRARAAERAGKSPRLLDQSRGSRLALSGAQRLQHESDFSDAPGPLAHISLQYKILALTGNEREGREFGHQHGENRCRNQPTQQRPRPEGYPHSLLHFIYWASTVTPTT
jgi:hypothetical protein